MNEDSPPPLRVVSLLPAATEIVCGLGARERLVGVSHECDHPADVQGLPVLTRTRVGDLPGSADIDRDVRAALREALAVFEVDLDALRAAAPDVIVTQDLCEVCAVPFEVVERAAAELLPGARLVSLRPTRLEHLFEDVERVGAALGLERQAVLWNAELGRRMHAVARRAVRAVASSDRPRVLSVEWLDPVMVGGTWMPQLVEMAGGRPLVAQAGRPAPTLSLDELEELAPDVVLFKPCGFTLERTRAEAPRVRDLARRLGGRAYVADGNAYFNRPGPRLVESLEILAACVHPEPFADLARLNAQAFVAVEELAQVAADSAPAR